MNSMWNFGLEYFKKVHSKPLIKSSFCRCMFWSFSHLHAGCQSMLPFGAAFALHPGVFCLLLPHAEIGKHVKFTCHGPGPTLTTNV